MSQKNRNETKRQYLNRVKQNEKFTNRRDRKKPINKTETSKRRPDTDLTKNEKTKLRKRKNVLKRKQGISEYKKS